MQDEQRLSVHGSRGVLTWRLRGDELYGMRSGQAELERIALQANATAPTFVSRFLASVRDGVERSPSFYDGLKAQEVIEAVLQSAAEQRWVPLCATDRPVIG
jgi:predicted dehydrogenase